MPNFLIDTVPIKNPSSFKIERYNITDLNRLSNGTIVGDLIAKKRKFYFTYEAISSYDLNIILDAIWNTSSIFYELTYIENNETKTAEVYVGSIPTELHRNSDGAEWIWKNVTFNLIER